MAFTRKYINLYKDIEQRLWTSYTIPIEWLNEIKLLMRFYLEDLEKGDMTYRIIQEGDEAIIKLERKLIEKYDRDTLVKLYQKGIRTFYYSPVELTRIKKDRKRISESIGADAGIQIISDENEVAIIIIDGLNKSLDDWIL